MDMRCIRLLIGMVTLAMSAMQAGADATRTFSIELHAESAALSPGAGRITTSTVNFVKGCQYVRHEIEVLETSPIVAPDRHPGFRETLKRDGTGKIIRLTVAAGAFRSLMSERGPASIAVRLSLEKMQRHMERNGWEVSKQFETER
jgi:hypothetical protein